MCHAASADLFYLTTLTADCSCAAPICHWPKGQKSTTPTAQTAITALATTKTQLHRLPGWHWKDENTPSDHALSFTELRANSLS
jgi:hypothetical protein